ncbi:cytosine methyltransferase [Volucribacter amazonae]|uniref:Cytosine methyltransferase n=1 Tax=Volucribacter amazonae TaxID=256731 RepID=A0A9X4PMB5_9PAST|nr:cytosine methyltransferase [Volucribacter amazonae]
MKFTYGSICSGIEAVTCAWHDFAQPLWFAEIEPFPMAVPVMRWIGLRIQQYLESEYNL